MNALRLDETAAPAGIIDADTGETLAPSLFPPGAALLEARTTRPRLARRRAARMTVHASKGWVRRRVRPPGWRGPVSATSLPATAMAWRRRLGMAIRRARQPGHLRAAQTRPAAARRAGGQAVSTDSWEALSEWIANADETAPNSRAGSARRDGRWRPVGFKSDNYASAPPPPPSKGTLTHGLRARARRVPHQVRRSKGAIEGQGMTRARRCTSPRHGASGWRCHSMAHGGGVRPPARRLRAPAGRMESCLRGRPVQEERSMTGQA